jgi:hypothetical protein
VGNRKCKSPWEKEWILYKLKVGEMDKINFFEDVQNWRVSVCDVSNRDAWTEGWCMVGAGEISDEVAPQDEF